MCFLFDLGCQLGCQTKSLWRGFGLWWHQPHKSAIRKWALLKKVGHGTWPWVLPLVPSTFLPGSSSAFWCQDARIWAFLCHALPPWCLGASWPWAETLQTELKWSSPPLSCKYKTCGPAMGKLVNRPRKGLGQKMKARGSDVSDTVTMQVCQYGLGMKRSSAQGQHNFLGNGFGSKGTGSPSKSV